MSLEKKNLCAYIPLELHNKISEKKDAMGLRLDEYVTQILTEYFEIKEKKEMSKIKTLAIQIDEELFNRMKNYVDSVPRLTQREFITDLIIKALDEIEVVTENEDSE